MPQINFRIIIIAFTLEACSDDIVKTQVCGPQGSSSHYQHC